MESSSDSRPHESGDFAVPPTGGGLTAIDYIFVEVGEGGSIAKLRRIIIPADSEVTCRGGALLVHHPGSASMHITHVSRTSAE